MPQRFLLNERIDSEFLTQRAAVEPEYIGGLALVTPRVIHDDLEEWSLHLTDDEIVQISRPIAIQGGEILIQCVFSVFAERLFAFSRHERVAVIVIVCHVG